MFLPLTIGWMGFGWMSGFAGLMMGWITGTG